MHANGIHLQTLRWHIVSAGKRHHASGQLARCLSALRVVRRSCYRVRKAGSADVRCSHKDMLWVVREKEDTQEGAPDVSSCQCAEQVIRTMCEHSGIMLEDICRVCKECAIRDELEI